jgi:hypothetical protein
MPDTPRGGVKPGHDLERVGPGFYVDNLGSEYFYLTGMYPCLLKHLPRQQPFRAAGFIAAVLEDLRTTLQGRYCEELMD